MDELSKQQFARTSGDGMEEEKPSKLEKSISIISESRVDGHITANEIRNKLARETPIPGQKTIYRPDEYISPPLPAVKPKGKVYYLVPKLVPSQPTDRMKHREPKFVPLEPYKAAVNPLVPAKKQTKIKTNKNNLDINILVSQMAQMKSSQLKTDPCPSDSSEKSELDKIKEDYENQIKQLREERDYSKTQLKFQVQVNSELKNLLVAAVGEDLQTKVNVLTEDKLQLARALLDSVNNLSTHTEQIEYLAGQCEVWRSKFLASSVMIEELARWKADLTQKNNLLSESNKKMLQLIAQIREMEIDVLKNLKFLAKLKTINVPSSNITDLTSECLNISQQLVLHSGIGIPENISFAHLDPMTSIEKLSVQALENSKQPLISTDEAFRAIFSKAFPAKSVLNAPENTDNNTNTPSSNDHRNKI